MEVSEDASLQDNLQTLDAQCFSAQYYFMICLGGFGATLMLLSLEMLIRIHHNPFGDKMSFFVIVLTLILIWVRSSPFALMAAQRSVLLSVTTPNMLLTVSGVDLHLVRAKVSVAHSSHGGGVCAPGHASEGSHASRLVQEGSGRHRPGHDLRLIQAQIPRCQQELADRAAQGSAARRRGGWQ